MLDKKEYETENSFFFHILIIAYSSGSRISRTGGKGAHFQAGGDNLLFNQIIAKNCMKMKEFGSRGGCASLVCPLDLPLACVPLEKYQIVKVSQGGSLVQRGAKVAKECEGCEGAKGAKSAKGC